MGSTHAQLPPLSPLSPLHAATAVASRDRVTRVERTGLVGGGVGAVWRSFFLARAGCVFQLSSAQHPPRQGSVMCRASPESEKARKRDGMATSANT